MGLGRYECAACEALLFVGVQINQLLQATFIQTGFDVQVENAGGVLKGPALTSCTAALPTS
jgi:hypothetical protein